MDSSSAIRTADEKPERAPAGDTEQARAVADLVAPHVCRRAPHRAVPAHSRIVIGTSSEDRQSNSGRLLTFSTEQLAYLA
jgi:hypothetical protein